MGLSAADIADVIEEIGPALADGWIQKVFQPSPRAVTFEIRTPGKTLWLHVSADPDMARLHLVSQRYPNPSSPPPFCQYLRAHIHGAQVEGIEQVQYDRIVRLHLTARNGPVILLAELMGRRSNLLVLDQNEQVLAALEHANDLVGTRYQPPIVQSHLTSPSASLKNETSNVTHPFPRSFAIEQHYRQREEAAALSRWKHTTLNELKKRIKKSARRVEVLQGDLEKAARYKEYARYGELLKANLDRMHKGAEQLTTVDYFDPALPELNIPLDPAKSPQANLDDYFKKHRKHIAAEREVRPRLSRAEEELTALRAEYADLERGIIRTEKGSTGQVAPITTSASPSKADRPRAGPYRRFISYDGLPIYVGRNARENETLTFSEARSDDLWLHARGTPGSHVIVRLEKGMDPPLESVRDAATLALLYSDLKKSGKGEVIYSRRKYVRKVKGSPPGTVTVTQEKSLFVTLDRIRLERLKMQAVHNKQELIRSKQLWGRR